MSASNLPHRDMQERVALIKERSLHPILFHRFKSCKFFFSFLQALGDEGYSDVLENRIFFFPVYRPAIQLKIDTPLNKGDNVIALDIMSLTALEKREAIAVLLHEIGHVVNPAKDAFENESNADEYAFARGFGKEIISSIPKLPQLPGEQNAQESSQKINGRRIERLKSKLTSQAL